MPYPSSPGKQQVRVYGLSLPPDLADRIDALEPRTGRRSQFICDTLEIGLERRFGPNWRELADRLRAEQDAARPLVEAAS